MNRLLKLCAVGMAWGCTPVLAADSSVRQEIRQSIYRVPLGDGASLFATGKLDDPAIARTLQEWVKAGKAEIVSEVTSTLPDGGNISLVDGQKYWLPTERDQDFDRLYLMPTSSEENLVGTRLNLQLGHWNRELNRLRTAKWAATFAERTPLLVKWPASWLEGPKAIHGWIEWYDTFHEEVRTVADLKPSGVTIIGVQPTSTHVWKPEDSGSGPLLDVMVAETPEAAQSPVATDHESPFSVLAGFVIPSNQALLLTQDKNRSDDTEIYQTLLKDAMAGKAGLRFFLGTITGIGNRVRVESSRRHWYPTEMPSIPSAWNERPVGTNAEWDAGNTGIVQLTLEHHVAPPRRQIWPLGIGEPELQMWEPAFRCLNLDSHPVIKENSTQLVALMKVPQVMTGEGLRADETLLVFARQHSETVAGPPAPANLPPKDPFAPEGSHVSEPLQLNLQIETHVFEVPASEAPQWKTAPANQFAAPDTERLGQLLKKATSGTAQLVGHGMVRTATGNRAEVSMTESVMTATEFDPPRAQGPHRMRPTALENLPTGTVLKVDASAGTVVNGKPEWISLDYSILQSAGRPVEPTLKATLKASGKTGNGPFPRAEQFDVEWSGGVKLVPGEPRCLGAKNVPGKSTGKVLVAFVTANVL